ncbi:MAG: acyltransferase [Muribaculaceae bacterium]|nr:acyltransferase [Muribaculaceae bacterium]
MPLQAPPHSQNTNTQHIIKKPRNSNLELYRIIVMLMIVAHHYVVNSGLTEILEKEPYSPAYLSMLIFGAWGKTGINCFVMITGWFMCKAKFTWQKFVKLYLQIIFYSIIIYGIFCVTGHEQFSVLRAVLFMFPVKSISDNFTSCFLIFYLMIPFINILIQHLDKRKHAILLILLLLVYSALPNFPKYSLHFNYVSWFCIIFIIASYIRFYGLPVKISHKMWGVITLITVLIGSASVAFMAYGWTSGAIRAFNPFFFVADSNKLLSLIIAVSSFMFFKDIHLPHSRLINAIGASTFGVLLIHANSNAMRTWLWTETVDCVGHYGDSVLFTVGYALVSILIIFFVCAGIEWFRGKFIEPHIMKVVENFISKKFHI